MTDVRQQREDDKARWAKYRQACARKYGVSIPPYTAVSEDADRAGAFVQITVWVSRDEAGV